MPALVVNGAAGRMGKHVLSLAAEDKDITLAGAVDRAGHPDLGKDAGRVAGIEALGVLISDTFPSKADVVIDFSLPEALDKVLVFCRASKAGLVLCTTGLGDEQQQKVKSASHDVPIVQATNMSVGMNLLFSLVGKVARALGEDYDIEIVESHHRFKKDSPSGTALTLAENIARETGREFPGCLVHGRHGKQALREGGTIGMHAIRAGDIVGEHSIIFGTLGETVRLSHTAHSRFTFATGALRAAKWLLGCNPGLYNMADVLGLE